MSTVNPALPPTRVPATSRAAIEESSDGDKLLLRVLIGALILLHGIAKLRGGLGPVTDLVVQHGLPASVATLAYVGEVIAPLFVIFGVFTRPAAFVVALHMLTAIALAHAKQIASLNAQGGWAIELQAMYLFGALAIVLLGAGRLSFGGLNGRWN